MLFRTLRFGLQSINKAPQFNVRAVTLASQASYSQVARGDAETELVRALDQEITFEKDNQESSVPDFLSEFRSLKLFKIEDVPGENEVVMTRDTGSEKITVTFSTDDINNCEENENSEEMVMSVSTVITIQKKNMNLGALTFQAIAENGSFHISHITHTPDAELAVAEDAESDYQRRGQYVGPVFDDLDESLSNAFHEYLESKGVDSQLADFIPNYVEFKEQLEYQRWLENVRKFIA